MNNLDRIIEYFKTELELSEDFYNKTQEEKRFWLNTQVLMFSSLIVVAVSLLQIAPTKWLFLSLSFFIVLFLLTIIIHLYSKKKEYAEHIAEKSGLETVLRCLLRLKVINIKTDDLKPIVDRIRLDIFDSRLSFIGNIDEYFEFKKKRLNEYLICMNQIEEKISKDRKIN